MRLNSIFVQGEEKVTSVIYKFQAIQKLVSVLPKIEKIAFNRWKSHLERDESIYRLDEIFRKKNKEMVICVFISLLRGMFK